MIEIKNGNKQCPLTYIINMFDHIKKITKKNNQRPSCSLRQKTKKRTVHMYLNDIVSIPYVTETITYIICA